jgi:ubiquinol-cytochrome c reductase cytochrome b subunit
MNALLNWLDDRTGYKAVLHDTLYENIPGGSRWRYVWGSTLVFTFTVQLITGTFLWMAYSPSAQTAWESVYYIQNEMQGGWLLRGIHHFTAQAMIVLLALHLFQVVVDGAYKAPREVNFWLGLVLMQIVLGLSLTGYLLPWDQKGYWATQVATKIAGTVPVVGAQMQKVVVGGPEYGHHTLTRFFALHAGVLPALLIGFLVLHIAVFRRHGITAKEPLRRPDQAFWPDQILKDAVACLAVLATVLVLVFYMGAELGAPADPANAYSAARPEWYFLFLFQFLKFFPGESEVIGAVVIPGVVMLLLFLMPLLGNWKIGHGFNIALLTGLLAGAGVLTGMAINEDRADLTYRNAVWEAHQFSKIANQRAGDGIPSVGAAAMMRQDPKAQALSVVTRQCLSCHSYVDDGGHGFTPEVPSAPNLHNFGRKEWIVGLLDPEKIVSAHYFGNTELKEGDMVNFVRDSMQDLGEGAAEKVAAALVAEAELPLSPEDQKLVEAGREILRDDSTGCAMCHQFHDAGSLGAAPDLTGYASRDWIVHMIANPGGEHFYGHLDAESQKMPAFEGRISDEVLGHIADWLRGDWDKPQAAPETEPAEPQPATAAEASRQR